MKSKVVFLSFFFHKNLRGIVRKVKSVSGSKGANFLAGYSGRGGGQFVKDFIQ
jgi:hypothetical protein